MSEVLIAFTLNGDLPLLLSHKNKGNGKGVSYPLKRRASMKDIIESLGIPHTEIGKIEVRGRQIACTFIPETNMSVDIFPFTLETYKSLPNLLWHENWDFNRFMVDKSVLKLGRNMRMAGFDTTVVPAAELKKIAILAEKEQRVILTRNRELLKCAGVKFGQLLRSVDPVEQIGEVFNRFDLYGKMKNFSRCLECNGLLGDVSKEEIIHQLEPLTKKHYQRFKRCEICRKIYWRGSHYENMLRVINSLAITP